MRTWFLPAIFCLSAFHSLGQKETSHWFLNGSRVTVSPAGISNTNPTGMSTKFRPTDCSTSVADSAGNLLFASDGNTVLDKNLSEMPAMSGKSMAGANKILAFKLPGSSRYYLFYTRADSYLQLSWTLRYAVIDLSLNNGTGDVVEYDRVIDTALSQGFTLVQAEGTETAWLVTHKLGTTKFLSYKISTAGLSATPVSSNAGSVATVFDYSYKELKTSLDGKLIAGMCYRVHPGIFAEAYKFVEVFNFDSNTGQLTERVRSTRANNYFFYDFSIDFSPDNRLLYVCGTERISGLQIFNWGWGQVFQFNLCYTDSIAFTNYAMVVANDFRPNAPFLTWGKIQLGADKKLYMPFSGTTISSINNPNRLGSYSNYQFNAHQVEVNNFSTVATPFFHHKLFEKAVKNNIVYSGGCFPAGTSFRITNDTIINIVWDFGDPASGSNTSSSTSAQHVFSAPGFYTVKADLYSSSGQLIERLSELVEIKDPSKRLLADYPRDTSFCEGGKMTLRLSAVNGVFHWTVRGIYGGIYHIQTADTLDINYSGTFFVELRQNDCDGCTLIDSIHVNVLPKANVVLYDRNLCTGDSLQLQVYEGPDWLWSTGDTTRSIWIHQGGTYWVRGEIDHNGCPGSDTVTITSVPGVQFSLPNDTTLCNYASLTLRPGVANASYAWQDGSYNNSFTVVQPGTYWVQITNSSFCRRSDTIHVSYVNAQQVNLGNDTTLCQGDSLVLQTNIGNAGYLWSTGAVSNSITVKQPGSYWLRVNNGSCSVTDTITVAFHTPPVVHLGNDTTLCEKDRLILHAGVVNASCLWSSGGRSDSLTVAQPGNYWVRVDQGGCVVRDSIDIGYKPVPALSLGNDTSICEKASLTLNAYGPSIQSYSWQNGSSQPALTVSSGGSYWVRVRGINGCTSADTVRVNITPLPVFSLGRDTVLCEGSNLKFQYALPGAAYQWSTGNNSNGLTIAQPGLYWLEVNQNGCTKRDSLQVNYQPLPRVFLGNDTSLCEGSEKLLDATNRNASYHWQDGSVLPTYLVSKPGAYSVTVNMNGCTQSDTTNVNYTYRPRFSLGKDTSICEGMQLTLDPRISNASLIWQDGSTGNVFVVKDPGIYRLTASNSCGSSTDEIEVERGVCQLLLPTAFTPNGDGLNDLFGIKYPGFIQTFAMTIYNRWGQIVFQTNDPAKGWDGKYKGLEQQTGAFVWHIILTTRQGEKMSSKGTVMLIR